MKRKMLSRGVIIFLLAFFSIYFFQTSLYRIRGNQNLAETDKDILLKEAAYPLQSLDVPVGAMLIYNDTVLSVGHNSVLLDSNVAGHAEINAINNAIRKTGFENFSRLDRDKLILVSTFEPCMMCRGAMIEYNIRHVCFMKGKGFFHWLKNDAKQLRYEWNKKKSDGDESQDSLFLLHPKYFEQHGH